jgi:hypothetical protein
MVLSTLQHFCFVLFPKHAVPIRHQTPASRVFLVHVHAKSLLIPHRGGHGVVASSPSASAQPKNHSKSAPLLLALDPLCVIQQQPLQKPKPQKLTQQQSDS